MRSKEACGRLLATLAVLSVFAAGAPARADDGVEIRIMTFNLRIPIDFEPGTTWEDRRPVICRILGDRAPDIVGLQEDLDPLLAEVRAALPEHDWVGEGSFGGGLGELNSIFYRRDRFRLVDHGAFWLSGTPEEPASRDWGNTFPCTVVWCELEVLDQSAASQRIRVYNTHFPHDHSEARGKSARLLAQRLLADRRSGSSPIVVIGDLNMTVDAEAARELLGAESLLRDSFAVALQKGEEHATLHRFTGKRTSRRRIDHILVSREFEVRTVEILTDNQEGIYPSDHFPVLAGLRLSGAR